MIDKIPDELIDAIADEVVRRLDERRAASAPAMRRSQEAVAEVISERMLSLREAAFAPRPSKPDQ